MPRRWGSLRLITDGVQHPGSAPEKSLNLQGSLLFQRGNPRSSSDRTRPGTRPTCLQSLGGGGSGPSRQAAWCDPGPPCKGGAAWDKFPHPSAPTSPSATWRSKRVSFAASGGHTLWPCCVCEMLVLPGCQKCLLSPIVIITIQGSGTASGQPGPFRLQAKLSREIRTGSSTPPPGREGEG